MDVVWLKRDVRLQDHEPLCLAAGGERSFIVLFIYEPDQLAHATVHHSHVAFVNEGLQDLHDRLQERSGGSAGVTLRYGEATAVLSELHAQHTLARLLSHEETGHGESYARDKRVARWCRANGITWLELPQSTAVRGISPMGGAWVAVWQHTLESFLQAEAKPDPFAMANPDSPNALRRLWFPGRFDLRSPEELGLGRSGGDRPYRQKGGERHARTLLDSFLQERGIRYSGSISSPITAWTACSRLSPYLSWGQISYRFLWQAVELKRQRSDGSWKRSLGAFLTRLQWRGHNVQKFEMRCWMEHRSMCEAWEHLRHGQTFMFGDPQLLGALAESERIAAYERGMTGYPFVDACLRCLINTGWLNFRMRCMVVSFAVFGLWLDWRAIAAHLARCFLDFEPGIHFSQLQMQAGTTGVDMRCYSVTKQAKDQDPRGEFIRRYVPELATVPDALVHEPWRCKDPSMLGSYPGRIVDEAKTTKVAKTAICAYQKWAQSGPHSGGPPPLGELLGRSDAPSLPGRPVKRAKVAAPTSTIFSCWAKQVARPLVDEQQLDPHVSEAPPMSKPDIVVEPEFPKPSSPLASWTCRVCTLINSATAHGPPHQCEACGAPPPARASDHADVSIIDLS